MRAGYSKGDEIRSIRKSFAAIIRKLFTGRKKARREPKPSADGTFNRDAVRRLQRHLQTARRRDSRPVSLSQGRNPHEEYVGQRHAVRLSKMSVWSESRRDFHQRQRRSRLRFPFQNSCASRATRLVVRKAQCRKIGMCASWKLSACLPVSIWSGQTGAAACEPAEWDRGSGRSIFVVQNSVIPNPRRRLLLRFDRDLDQHRMSNS